MQRARHYYYPYLYPSFGYYDPSGKNFLPADGSGLSKEEVAKAIASIIVDNRKELIDKLDELEMACSCTMNGASDADLSDVIVENIGNEKLRNWIGERTAQKFYHSADAGAGSGSGAGGGAAGSWISAITEVLKTTGIIIGGAQQNKAAKQEYKNLITQKALEYKAAQEKAKRNERTTNTIMIAGASLLAIGFGAAIYFSSRQTQNTQLSLQSA